jgi:hypothetical protein
MPARRRAKEFFAGAFIDNLECPSTSTLESAEKQSFHQL